MLTVCLSLIIVWNIVVFLLMGIDKKRAIKGKYRISEKNLFICAFCFGAIGGTIGMKVFRHKTKHWYFKFGFPILAIIQAVLYFYLFTNIF